jgi:multiple sugar transport system permease protein
LAYRATDQPDAAGDARYLDEYQYVERLFLAFLVGREENVRVLTVALGIFRSQTPQGVPDWTGLMAGTLLSILPIFLLLIFLGRRIVDSLAFSGLK